MALILALGIGALMAQRAPKGALNAGFRAMHRAESPMQRCIEELDLNEVQLKKISENRMAFEKQENSLVSEIKNLRLDVITAMKAENFKRVKDLNQQISTKELALMNARVDLMANNMKELNKEQKESMLKNMPMWMGDGRMMRANRGENFRSMHRNRRAPGMGMRQNDWENCPDYDGERKYRNRD
jgi:hypothetical protein